MNQKSRRRVQMKIELRHVNEENTGVEQGHVGDEHCRRCATERFPVDHDQRQKIAEKTTDDDDDFDAKESFSHAHFE